MCSSVKQVRARTSPRYLLHSFSHSQSRESIPPAFLYFLTSEIVVLTSLQLQIFLLCLTHVTILSSVQIYLCYWHMSNWQLCQSFTHNDMRSCNTGLCLQVSLSVNHQNLYAKFVLKEKLIVWQIQLWERKTRRIFSTMLHILGNKTWNKPL